MNIDREISEKVMGLAVHEHNGAYLESGGVNARPADILRAYSSDIKYAMVVEAEMFRRGWRYRSGHNAGGYWCE